MSVYERIAAVMTDVTYLTRDCDMGDFWTLSDERVTSAVRASLIKNGLVIIPIATETQTKDAIAATITYRIQGIDDDGINVCMSGAGETLGHNGENTEIIAEISADQISDLFQNRTDDQCGKQAEGHAAQTINKNQI